MDQIPSHIVDKAIEKYQEHVSDGLADERQYQCRYTPSCSHYTQDAIEEYGVIKGGMMGFMRMMRCHKTAEGGYDPVLPKDQAGNERDFVPAHEHFHFESADTIMSYPSRSDSLPFNILHTHEHGAPEKSATIGGRVGGVLKNALTNACAFGGAMAGGVLFAAAGAAIGGWLGATAGDDKIDRLNAAIAGKFSPESVYGFAKIENALGKASYRINRSVLAETGSKVAAHVAGVLAGGPVGAAVGIWKGMKEGVRMGGQFGSLFGRSVSGLGHKRDHHPPAQAEPAQTPYEIHSTYLREKPVFPLGGTTVTPLINDEIDRGMEELIKEATTSIDIEIFSIRNATMVELLKKKLADGVHVRVINNPLGRNKEERELHRRAIDELKSSGAEVLAFPILEAAWQFNHSKLLIVDNRAAIIGSKNWSDDARMKRDFDAAFLMTGDTVDEARQIFEKDWATSGGRAVRVRHRDESPAIELKTNSPLHYDAANDVLQSIKNANHSIDVGMYWLTDRKAIDELCKASTDRHVRVRVLLSRSDENRPAREKLEEAGIEVKVFTPPQDDQKISYHTKMAIFDDEKVILGSCDWTTQAFYLNHELNISARDSGLALYMKAGFEKDWTGNASPTQSFDKAFEFKGIDRIRVFNRKLAQKLPSSLAKAGMVIAGLASIAKRALAPGCTHEPPGETPGIAAADPLPPNREPVKMERVKPVAASGGAQSPLIKTELNPSMMSLPGNILVKLDCGDEKLTIPKAAALARSLARELPGGALDSKSVTEIVVLNDFNQLGQIAASPSGKITRTTGDGFVLDHDVSQPFRRIYILRDRLTPDLKIPVGTNLNTLKDPGGLQTLTVTPLSPRPLKPLIQPSASLFCGGLISISAEPPEGFFSASTATEMRERGHELRKADQADVWLYRVPDSRKDSYFSFTYSNPDRPADTPREGKFKIATGPGPAGDPLSEGGSEADLLWFGDEQHGAIEEYLRTISKPDLTLEDLYGQEGFIQRISDHEVFLGHPDRSHYMTKEGFNALKTDPDLYRRVYSEEYDKYLKSLFEDKGPAKASYLLATSRGCTQGCNICCSGGTKPFQFFSAPRIMEELEKIAAREKPGNGEVIDLFFLDSNLNNNPERLIELAEMYEKSPLKGKFRFYCRHSSPNGFLKAGHDGRKHANRDLLEAYKKLGLDQVFMGIDTYDDNSTLTLKTGRNKVAAKGAQVRPTYRADEIRELIKGFEEFGLVSKGFFVTNNPWVTDMDRLDSYYNLIQLWLENPHFSIDSRNREVLQLKPFEGSPIEKVTTQMNLNVLSGRRFVAQGVLGELDELMQFSGLGSPRSTGDAGAALREFSEGITAIRKKAEAVLSDPARTAEDRHQAELIIRKLIERDGWLEKTIEGEATSGTPGSGELLARAKEFSGAHRDLPPFDPADQQSEFLKSAETLFDGLRRTLPLKMEPPHAPKEAAPPLQNKAGCASCEKNNCASCEMTGYRSEIAHLIPDDPHTIHDVEKYLCDNLGAATLEAARRGNERFLIFQGEGSEVYSEMRNRGWEILGFVPKSEGFHQVCRVRTEKGEIINVIARINGDDRVLHIQSLLKLAGLPAERISTTGKYHHFKEDYLRTFRKLGDAPDYVIYGMGKTAATAMMTSRPLHNVKELANVFLQESHSSRTTSKMSQNPHDLDGLAMHVMELENGKRIWFFPPLYGDLSKDIMEALIDFGAKDITYMGTIGAVNSKLRVGQMVSPTVRIAPDGTREKLDWLTPSSGTIPSTYMRVSTPNIETARWAQDSVEKGVDTIEVELGYWLDEMKKHPDIKFRVQNVVSDVLLGAHASDMTQWNTLDKMKSLNGIRKSLKEGLQPGSLAIKSYRAVSMRE